VDTFQEIARIQNGVTKGPQAQEGTETKGEDLVIKMCFFSSPKKKFKSSHFLKNKNTKIIFFKIMMSLIGPPLFFPLSTQTWG